MKSFIGITGTTGVGKSDVSVKLAKMLNTDIISADSMQVYKGMDIGTAKIPKENRQGVKHFMLDVVAPNEQFSAYDYQQIASKIIDSAKNIPIVVGGTGLYFDSLLYPPEFGRSNEQRRKQLKEILNNDGISALQKILLQIDEESYNIIDLKNPVRVMRAIEIAECGESRARGKVKMSPEYNCRLFVLQRNREKLYENIDKRVDMMIENGLVQEVKKILNAYGVCDTPAFAAIGYKEIIENLLGKGTLKDAVEKIKLNTRHYAKRQVTYFKKMNVYRYIDVDELSTDQIAAQIYAEVQDFSENK